MSLSLDPRQACGTLKEGSGFISSYENNVYRFITRTDIRAEVVNGTASFENVELSEGSLITTRTTVDGSLTNQRFRIENASVDVDTKECVYSNHRTLASLKSTRLRIIFLILDQQTRSSLSMRWKMRSMNYSLEMAL